MTNKIIPYQQNQTLPQLHGVLVLNKPSGPTSARCLTALKKLGQKKIGHAGTLDPLASGVLQVLLGQATKLSAHLQAGGKKIYSGRLQLGITTDTWDIQGKILSQSPLGNISPEDVQREIQAWKNLQTQEVPAYSAAKHQGQPLYKLARKGKNTPVKLKQISVFEADMLEVGMPYVRFRVTCGSGAYIRSLAHSLGMRLGCGAALSELTREYSHPFSLAQAVELDAILERPELLSQSLQPLADALPDWPRIELSPLEASLAKHGNPVPAGQASGAQALLMENGVPIALAELAGSHWRIARGLWS